MHICLLLLTLLVTTSSAFWTDEGPFTLALRSGLSAQDIPSLSLCSCRLVAFPVFDLSYSVTITPENPEQHTHVQIHLSSGKCGVAKIRSNG